jgi:D-sedoheptulose 7-phosphate isomerase
VTHARRFLDEHVEVLEHMDVAQIERLVELLLEVRHRGGRLFFLGVGGGAANSSHAVCDFRKIAGFEAYSPVDNVAELTAQVNDEGWPAALTNWLGESRLSADDLVFVLSVGGGDETRGVSTNLVEALRFARERGAAIAGIVGRDGGFTAEVADAAVVVPTVAGAVTAHTEVAQVLLCHLLVSDPRLQRAPMKWESLVDTP